MEKEKEEQKTASQFLLEYGIDIISIDSDDFNSSLLAAMERYAEAYASHKEEEAEKRGWEAGAEAMRKSIYARYANGVLSDIAILDCTIPSFSPSPKEQKHNP